VLGMLTIGMSAVSAAETKSIAVTSNIGVSSDAQYSDTSEQVTVTFKLKSDLTIVATQAVMTFDTTVLKVASTNTAATVMPNFSGAVVNLTKTDGRIPMNWTNYQGNEAFKDTEAVYATVVFDIIKKGTDTTVNLQVDDLTGSTDPDAGVAKDVKIIDTYEDICDNTHFTASVEEKVTPDGVDYSGFFNGNSLNLEGKVGVRFYFVIPDQFKGHTIKAVLTGPNGDVEVPFDATTQQGSEYVGNYFIRSIDMTREIVAKIYIDGQYATEKPYSAKNWIDTALAKSTNPKTLALAKTLANYGAKAQIYFDAAGVDTNVDKLANEGVDYTAPEVKASDITVNTYPDPDLSSVGLGTVSKSLVLDSDTAIKTYFVITDQAKLDAATVKVKGETQAYEKQGSEAMYVIGNIWSNQFDTEFNVDFGNGLKYTTSVMSSAKTILEKSSNAKFRDVAAALYLYGNAAKDYFGV